MLLAEALATNGLLEPAPATTAEAEVGAEAGAKAEVEAGGGSASLLELSGWGEAEGGVLEEELTPVLDAPLGGLGALRAWVFDDASDTQPPGLARPAHAATAATTAARRPKSPPRAPPDSSGAAAPSGESDGVGGRESGEGGEGGVGGEGGEGGEGGGAGGAALLLLRLGGAELASAQRELATLDLALHRRRGQLRAHWAARCPYYGEVEFGALYDAVVLRGRGAPPPPPPPPPEAADAAPAARSGLATATAAPPEAAVALLCEGESARPLPALAARRAQLARLQASM